MNLIGSRPTGWWNDPDRAMREMTELLEFFATTTGDDVTVVFDKQPDRLQEPKHARVVFAKWRGRNAADHEIEEIVAAEPDPGDLTVVSSDKQLVEKVRNLGARTLSSGRFRKRLDDLEA